MPKTGRNQDESRHDEVMDRRAYKLRKQGLAFKGIERTLRLPRGNGNNAWRCVLRAEQKWGPLPREVSIVLKRQEAAAKATENPTWSSRAGAPEPDIAPAPGQPKAERTNATVERQAFLKLKDLLVKALAYVDRKLGA